QERRTLSRHDRLHHVAGDARRRHEDADAVDREHHDREQNAPTQLRNCADIGEDAQREPPSSTTRTGPRPVSGYSAARGPLCGRGSSSTVPRAFSIFSRALALIAFTFTVMARSISP